MISEQNLPYKIIKHNVCKTQLKTQRFNIKECTECTLHSEDWTLVVGIFTVFMSLCIFQNYLYMYCCNLSCDRLSCVRT